MGLIYLLHFDRSYHRARHYLGYTEDLEARLAAHRAGRGSPLVAAAIRDGIDFQLAATRPGDGTEERRMHRYRNSPRRLCPICREQSVGVSGLATSTAVAATAASPACCARWTSSQLSARSTTQTRHKPRPINQRR
jgi:hypothetical protein